nr:hypothetical protein [Tanacetum cinerariifolium]
MFTKDKIKCKGIEIKDRAAEVLAPSVPRLDQRGNMLLWLGPKVVEGAHANEEGVQAILTSIQAPHPPPSAATRTMTQRMARLKEETHRL